jgi:hypothetical protein
MHKAASEANLEGIDQKGKQTIAKIRFFVYNGCNIIKTRCGLLFCQTLRVLPATISETIQAQ